MVEFKLTIDITDKLADAVSALSTSIAAVRKCHAASVTESVAQGKSSSAPTPSHTKAPQCAQEAPECTKEPEPVITQAEPENAKIDMPEPQESARAIDEEQAADCAGVRFHCPTPAQALPATAVSTDADAAPAQQEKQEPEKPKKKKSAKKAAETPAPAEAPRPESKPEPPVVEAPEKPEPAKAEAAKPDATADGDPMGGMTVMEAVQALFDAIQQKGLEMADVNARVRAKANAIGLSYSSIACLIKAVGYVEARRIALGE